MLFDLENLNPSARFFWNDSDSLPDEEQEWVEFRLASDEDTDTMRRRAGIKQRVEYKRVGRGGPQRFEFIDTNEKNLREFMDMINDHAIVTWRILNRDGDEIPCTKENKNLLINGSPAFSEWMAQCLEKMRGDTAITKEEEVKNS